MERKNLEITEPYVEPVMDVIEIPDEYALVTAGCGSTGISDLNEGPMNDIF